MVGRAANIALIAKKDFESPQKLLFLEEVVKCSGVQRYRNALGPILEISFARDYSFSVILKKQTSPYYRSIILFNYNSAAGILLYSQCYEYKWCLINYI